MQVTVKGRNVPVTDELRESVARRFDKVARQVSDLAVLEVELCTERDSSSADDQVAEATLYLKGITLRAKDRSRDMTHAIGLIADEMGVQVKRHRDKRRARREARSVTTEAQVPPAF
jgi:putative sigma-54 modulation protein